MITETCSACGEPLLLKNLYMDDGCPCNSVRGVNVKPQACKLCKTDNCVKPGHHLRTVFGDVVPVEPCNKMPPGWTCSRERGHEGPCAARPVIADQADCG
jgi:hypothetical protein